MKLPNHPYVSLNDALDWVHEISSKSNPIDRTCLEQALTLILDKAVEGKIRLVGKHAQSYPAEPSEIQLHAIPKLALLEYRQWDRDNIALRHGEGLLGFPDQNGEWSPDQITGREDFYCDVRLNRADLLDEFPAAKAIVAGTVGAERKCETWLDAAFANDGSPHRSKAHFKQQAQREIPGLTGRGFDRAWAKSAPSAGRSAAGRKKLAR
ncbi:hypothetical protein [Altererythrobacter ishigakiensis]|uniref:Uncharacterized protein n=1 Tax=Altererythrobacter ishigakiensis TaxID=476157 RepID=A0A562UT32_9SPHN|nr:hypothetical protein [Altererythrobacter ishigakiensis]TWJ08769.1 hypothetical protein JN10_0385 [Altererythrobacter ishigakiensis]